MWNTRSFCMRLSIIQILLRHSLEIETAIYVSVKSHLERRSFNFNYFASKTFIKYCSITESLGELWLLLETAKVIAYCIIVY
jgi:hypothetical protein